MKTSQFLDNVIAGNASVAKESLNDLLSARAFEALEGRKVELAQRIYSRAEVQEEQLNLEDYSLEELKEFIDSEEFDQLDELKKSTLQSYYKKSVDSGLRAQHRATNSLMGGSDAEHKKNVAAIDKRMSGQDAVTKRLGSKATMAMDKEMGVSRYKSPRHKPTRPNPKRYSEEVEE